MNSTLTIGKLKEILQRHALSDDCPVELLVEIFDDEPQMTQYELPILDCFPIRDKSVLIMSHEAMSPGHFQSDETAPKPKSTPTSKLKFIANWLLCQNDKRESGNQFRVQRGQIWYRDTVWFDIDPCYCEGDNCPGWVMKMLLPEEYS